MSLEKLIKWKMVWSNSLYEQNRIFNVVFVDCSVVSFPVDSSSCFVLRRKALVIHKNKKMYLILEKPGNSCRIDNKSISL